MAEMFPMFVKLAGRPCLVVGAGRVAEGKIASLVRCGARVRVVAPQATPVIREWAREGKIWWEARRFRRGDLAGAFLVVAATSSPKLHEEIFRQAQRGGVVCNTVDEPERCDFYYPAVVRRGPLQIAISTGGRSPSLAQRVRKELEAQFPAEYTAWTEAIGRKRAAMMAADASPERKERLRRLASARAFVNFRQQTRAARRGKRRT
jgi:precorrin-2 dehydrogenase/sirohydrochlorin ferrochelatase